ncbi:MAG: hypothetical protein AAF333_13390 [Planctomycetota bacterium]
MNRRADDSLIDAVKARQQVEGLPREFGDGMPAVVFGWGRIQELHENYFKLETGLAVAKPKSCRFDPTLYPLVSGIVANPDDPTFNSMTATLDAGGTEICEVRLYRFQVGDRILFVEDLEPTGVLDGEGNPIHHLDVNLDARAWSKVKAFTPIGGGA